MIGVFYFMFPFSVVVVPDFVSVTAVSNNKITDSVKPENEIPNTLTIGLFG